MATFDAELKGVGEYVAAMRRSGRLVREFTAPVALPIRVGRGAASKIILRTDAFIELGNPAAGSCAFILWTDTPSLIRDGRVRLIGPDIPEAPGASLPFGQVVLVGGASLGPEEHRSLTEAQYVADQIEGYMVRSSSQHMWSRIDKDVAAKGFRFEVLGRALMAVFKTNLPKVEAMEIVFVTSAKEDVLQLNDIGNHVRQVGSDIVKEHWKARGFDLDCSFDCRSCHDKQVCTDIREILAAHKKVPRDGAALA